jgi:hypothetical protein
MARVRDAFHVDAPQAFVYDIATDPERMLDWHANFVAIFDLSGPLDRPGAGYRAQLRLLGRRIEGEVVIVEAIRPTLHVFSATAPRGGRGRSVTRFTRMGAGTDVEVEIDVTLPGGLFGGLADGAFLEAAVERDIRHSNATLKALIELEHRTGRRA